VLMNGYTWHARFHNRSDRARKVLEYSYVHAWMKTMYEFSDLSPHVQDLIMRSHNRRQLFGVPEPGQSEWARRFEGSPAYTAAEGGEAMEGGGANVCARGGRRGIMRRRAWSGGGLSRRQGWYRGSPPFQRRAPLAIQCRPSRAGWTRYTKRLLPFDAP